MLRLLQFVEKDLVILTKLYLVIFNGLPEVIRVLIPILQLVQMLQAIDSDLEYGACLMQYLMILMLHRLQLFGRSQFLRCLPEEHPV